MSTLIFFVVVHLMRVCLVTHYHGRRNHKLLAKDFSSGPWGNKMN